MRGKTKGLLCVLFSALCIFVAAAGAADAVISDSVTVMAADASGAELLTDGGDKIAYALGVPLKRVGVSVIKTERVILGGQSFGVKLKLDGVQISGMTKVRGVEGESDPASDAGLAVNDVITEANGEKINSSEDFIRLVAESGGAPVRVIYRRGGEQRETELKPIRDENGIYKAGLWIKDSSAGIGTLTYMTEDGVSFGGLGHGICDPELQKPYRFNDGEIYGATITGCKAGKAGDPGELRGYFGAERTGSVEKNTGSGVFGKFDKAVSGDRIEVALKNNVREGACSIVCTVDETGPHVYDAQITCILSGTSETKNFIIRVTDKKLIEKTGGIVQGMSGSPVIQNGRLVGAVTHVLVNDPSRGYGIFIENMLVYSE